MHPEVNASQIHYAPLQRYLDVYCATHRTALPALPLYPLGSRQRHQFRGIFPPVDRAGPQHGALRQTIPEILLHHTNDTRQQEGQETRFHLFGHHANEPDHDFRRPGIGVHIGLLKAHMWMPFQDLVYSHFVMDAGKTEQRMPIIGELFIELIEEAESARVAIRATQYAMADGHGRIVRVEPAVPPGTEHLLIRIDTHVGHGTEHLTTGERRRTTMVPPPQTGGGSGIHMPGRHGTRTDDDTGECADIPWIVIGHVVQEPIHDAQLALMVYAPRVGA